MAVRLGMLLESAHSDIDEIHTRQAFRAPELPARAEAAVLALFDQSQGLEMGLTERHADRWATSLEIGGSLVVERDRSERGRVSEVHPH